jgi:hypothetical protein
MVQRAMPVSVPSQGRVRPTARLPLKHQTILENRANRLAREELLRALRHQMTAHREALGILRNSTAALPPVM